MASFPNESTANMTSQEAEVNFSYLPDVVLLDIFKRCPRTDFKLLSEVCERFQRIIKDRELWKKISLTQLQLTGARLEKTLASCEGIAEVDLSGSTVDCSIFMSDYWRNKGDDKFISLHLETLNLSNVRFEDASLDMSYDQGRNRVVNKFYAGEVEMKIYQTGIFFMLDKFKPKKLIVNNATPRHIAMIFESHKNFQLDAISLENMTAEKSERISYPFRYVGNKLREINLSNSVLNAPQLFVMCCVPDSTEKLLLHNVKLTQRYSDIFETIIRSGPNLKCLGVTRAYLEDIDVLRTLGEHKHLESLRLYHEEWESLPGNKVEFFSNILKTQLTLKNIHFVTMQGVDLSQLQKNKIQIQVATLRKRINTLLGIDVRADIYYCNFKLHFNTENRIKKFYGWGLVNAGSMYEYVT